MTADSSVRQSHAINVGAVMRHQQPTAQALFHLARAAAKGPL
jgi:hypothetical protein